MINYIINNLGNIFLIAVIGLALILAFRLVVKDAKNTGSLCGGDCKNCGHCFNLENKE